MASWKEGQNVRIKTRPVTDQDREKNHYFEHMGGLRGTVQNIYADNEIAVKIDPDSLSDITKKVHKESVNRMREKFLQNTSEEQKKQLTAEEMNFTANYVLLVQGADLELI